MSKLQLPPPNGLFPLWTQTVFKSAKRASFTDPSIGSARVGATCPCPPTRERVADGCRFRVVSRRVVALGDLGWRLPAMLTCYPMTRGLPLIPAMFPVSEVPFSRRRRAHTPNPDVCVGGSGRPTRVAQQDPVRCMMGLVGSMPAAGPSTDLAARSALVLGARPMCPSPSGEGLAMHWEHGGDEGKVLSSAGRKRCA
jgi:hypothetical protein